MDTPEVRRSPNSLAGAGPYTRSMSLGLKRTEERTHERWHRENLKYLSLKHSFVLASPTGEIWNTVFAQLESFNSLRDMSLAA